MKLEYDNSDDVLYVTFKDHPPESCNLSENESGDIVQRDRSTGEVVGVAIVSFIMRLKAENLLEKK